MDSYEIEKQLNDLDHILSILEERIYESSEVLITSEDLSFKNALEDMLKFKEALRSTSVSILTPDKRSKLFTKATLAVDAFFGDRLIYTRSSDEMLQFLRSYYKDRDNDHLIWIKNSDMKRKTNRKLFLDERADSQFLDKLLIRLIRQNSTITTYSLLLQFQHSLKMLELTRSTESIIRQSILIQIS